MGIRVRGAFVSKRYTINLANTLPVYIDDFILSLVIKFVTKILFKFNNIFPIVQTPVYCSLYCSIGRNKIFIAKLSLNFSGIKNNMIVL